LENYYLTLLLCIYYKGNVYICKVTNGQLNNVKRRAVRISAAAELSVKSKKDNDSQLHERDAEAGQKLMFFSAAYL